MRIKRLTRRGKESYYVLVDKAILQSLNFGEFISFEVKNDSIIIKPYRGDVGDEFIKRSRKKIL
jgi:hypothetical protein